MKKCQALIAVYLMLSLTLIGCAHSTANPIPIAQIGDETRGCQSLAQEIQQMQMLIHTSKSEGSQQTAKNVVLGATGVFLLVPWFFMDLGNASSIEKKAAQARLERLHSLYQDKKCHLQDAPTVVPKAKS